MSPKLPRVTAIQLVRVLHKAGWYDVDQSGSHLTLRHSEKSGKVIIPMHRGKTLKLGTLASILDDAELTPDEFRRIL